MFPAVPSVNNRPRIDLKWVTFTEELGPHRNSRSFPEKIAEKIAEKIPEKIPEKIAVLQSCLAAMFELGDLTATIGNS